MTNIINGRQLAKQTLAEISDAVAKLSFKPLICDIVSAADSVALSYVKIKEKTAREVGMDFQIIELSPQSTTQSVIEQINSVQKQPELCGLIVQLPIPLGIDQTAVLTSLDPKVDVDCIGPINSQAFYSGRAPFYPPTAAAILAMIDSLKIKHYDLNYLVLGQGELVGRPITTLLQRRGYKVKIADRQTANTDQLIKQADLIVSATGQPGLVTGLKIKKGSVLIDAGTSESGAGIVGDVDQDSVNGIASYVTPVPGGVGPMTVAMLLANSLLTAQTKF